jgi:hypothetical protein
MAARNPHRDYSTPRTDIVAVTVARDDPRYIEKSIYRLAVLEDKRKLESAAEIRAALNRWRHCLFDGQVKRLERWLAAQ